MIWWEWKAGRLSKTIPRSDRLSTDRTNDMCKHHLGAPIALVDWSFVSALWSHHQPLSEGEIITWQEVPINAAAILMPNT